MGRHCLRSTCLRNEGPGQRPAVGGNAQQGAAVHVWSICVATPAGRARERPGVYQVRIEHDGCCAIWQGKPCNCTPIVRKPQAVRSG